MEPRFRMPVRQALAVAALLCLSGAFRAVEALDWCYPRMLTNPPPCPSPSQCCSVWVILGSGDVACNGSDNSWDRSPPKLDTCCRAFAAPALTTAGQAAAPTEHATPAATLSACRRLRRCRRCRRRLRLSQHCSHHCRHHCHRRHHRHPHRHRLQLMPHYCRPPPLHCLLWRRLPHLPPLCPLCPQRSCFPRRPTPPASTSLWI